LPFHLGIHTTLNSDAFADDIGMSEYYPSINSRLKNKATAKYFFFWT